MPYAPGASNPDTQSQAEMYNPMGGLGMGPAAGAITSATFSKLAAEWFQALRSLGGATIRERLASLPTLQNIIELSGGMNVGSPITPALQGFGKSVADLDKLPSEQAMPMVRSIVDANSRGAFQANAQHFYPRSLNVETGLQKHWTQGDSLLEVSPTEMLRMQGGGVPPPTVWDRTINAAGGVNGPQVQRMLGLGK